MFQYFSDIHTEMSNYVYSDNMIERVAPNLIIAGDIGNPFDDKYKKFLSKLSCKFDKIFIIAGNHEYYSFYKNKVQYDRNQMNWFDVVVNQIISVVSQFTNIIFLNNDTYDIENTNITIFGGTFWTRINDDEDVGNFVSDYIHIPEFTKTVSNNLHEIAIQKLSNVLKTDRLLVVISHHIPKMNLIDIRYRHSGYDSAFASDIVEADNIKIVAWIYGHTHLPKIQGKFFANPIGYPNENHNINYNKIIVINQT